MPYHNDWLFFPLLTEKIKEGTMSTDADPVNSKASLGMALSMDHHFAS